MNQDQQPQPWWKDKLKDHWPIAVLVATVLVILLTDLLGVWRSWERSFWDWLGLLIIPVVLGLGGIWFNTQTRKSEQELASRERENDRQIAEDRAREEALQRYLDTMQELILDKGLRRSEKDAEIRSVARARTLTVLRSLDGNRKGQVLRFLYEAALITGKVVREDSGERQFTEAIIDLKDADLRDADLSSADLNVSNLSGADLRGADLGYAHLSSADLSYASLRDANLSGANLSYADLSGTDLRDASLVDTYLRDANLSRTGLGGALLFGTDLGGARESTNKQLAQAESLVGATMPDGTVVTEEGWEEFKKRY
jgi:pentapeptide repeat protein